MSFLSKTPRIAAVTAFLMAIGVAYNAVTEHAAVECRRRAWPWIAASVIFTTPVLFVQAYVIPTGAMERTVLRGDRLLVQTFPRPSFVRGDLSNKTVYRNGAALDEPYVQHITTYVDPYRDNSLDSRYWGFVVSDDLLGKPVMVFESRDEETDRRRWERIFHRLTDK